MQDHLAVLADFRKPDWFITYSANPAWNEVVENLLAEKKLSPGLIWLTECSGENIRIPEGYRSFFYSAYKSLV